MSSLDAKSIHYQEGLDLTCPGAYLSLSLAARWGSLVSSLRKLLGNVIRFMYYLFKIMIYHYFMFTCLHHHFITPITYSNCVGLTLSRTPVMNCLFLYLSSSTPEPASPPVDLPIMKPIRMLIMRPRPAEIASTVNSFLPKYITRSVYIEYTGYRLKVVQCTPLYSLLLGNFLQTGSSRAQGLCLGQHD